MTYTIVVENLWKKYKHGYIFKKINARVQSGQILSIAGRNGAGKTTILKMISGLVPADRGSIKIYQDDILLNFPYTGSLGYLGPYLELYDKLTARENLQFVASQLNITPSEENILNIFSKIGLQGREDDWVETFSSGMKQRLKYGLLYLKEFPIILLDEPTSNFDEAGKNLFRTLIEEKRDNILIIASNEPEEVKLGDIVVDIS